MFFLAARFLSRKERAKSVLVALYRIFGRNSGRLTGFEAVCGAATRLAPATGPDDLNQKRCCPRAQPMVLVNFLLLSSG